MECGGYDKAMGGGDAMARRAAVPLCYGDNCATILIASKQRLGSYYTLR